MMTPKMKEDLCTQILDASRQLFLSARISELCHEKGTQKQLEFILELMNEELALRDENRRFQQGGTGITGFRPRPEKSCTLWSGRSWKNPYGDSRRRKGL